MKKIALLLTLTMILLQNPAQGLERIPNYSSNDGIFGGDSISRQLGLGEPIPGPLSPVKKNSTSLETPTTPPAPSISDLQNKAVKREPGQDVGFFKD